MAEWYYEQDGGHVGPVSEADLNVMLSNRLIDASTRVWTASFGQQWKHAHETELQMPRPTTPPPLPPSTKPALQASPPAAPPPAPTGQPVLARPGAATEKWAIWLACLPIILLAVETAFVAAGFDPYGHNAQARGISIWTGIATIWLAYMDAKGVNNAGLNPQRRWILPFIVLTPIGYFIRRRYVAAAPLTPLWIWLVSFIVYLLGEGALSAR